MEAYHKIQTAWLRDPEARFKTLLEGQWAKPEFEYLQGLEWEITEKVDGTNVRLWVEGGFAQIRGKTNNAQLHPLLVEAATPVVERMASLPELDGLTLYGEGVGPKVQGGWYLERHEVVLFDVFSRDSGNWLERAAVEEIAAKVGARVVPVLGRGPLREAFAIARNRLPSTLFNGACIQEGVVARPKYELRDRRGDRIVTKLKAKDFPKGCE